MTDIEVDKTALSGVSIIILTRNGADHLDRLFSTFFKLNSYSPIEFIIVDHLSKDNTADIIARYADRADILHIERDFNYSYAASNNMASQKAVYSNLLFVNNDIIYTSDVLHHALKVLKDPVVGAVGMRLDDASYKLPPGSEPAVQHSGVCFVWDEEKAFYRPTQIRHASVAELEANGIKSGIYPAVTAAFLICAKEDFKAVGGFCEQYDYGFEDIDFCLKLAIELDKKCYCINEMSLQHVERATRKYVDPEIKKNRKNKNDALFKQRMGLLVKEFTEAGELPRAVFADQDLKQSVQEDITAYQNIYTD